MHAPRFSKTPSPEDTGAANAGARHLAAALLLTLCAAPAAHAANIAPEGTGIIGVNDVVDADEGTSLPHAGDVAAINDGDLITRVDTFSDGGQNVSFVGILWDTPRTDAVKSLVLTMATFGDGGWFGAPGAGPAAGGVLTEAHLMPQPIVQTTADGGITWEEAAATSNYTLAFTGHAIGGGAVPNPSSKAATFTLTISKSGINGIRIIGENGGGADGNGFIGVFELVVNSVPANDSDGDGMDNVWETANGTDPNVNDAAADPDNDGLSNLQEYDATTNPQDDDSDNDGLKDGPEVLIYLSNPLATDSDSDGLTDGDEVNIYGSNPATADSDGDGLTDGAEVNTYQTSPVLADTDGDGFRDNHELNSGTDPKAATSFPSNIALLGTAIMGINDALDGDAGTPFTHAGSAFNINDGILTTSVDTYTPEEPFAYAGILWPAVRTVAVDRLELTFATFTNGGWFGPNGADPGQGGALTAAGEGGEDYLTEPVVQVTSNNGLNWTTAPHTTNYLTALEGHLIGGGGQPNPSSVRASFTLTPPVANINGIRIIGEEGGTASGGFIGVFELEVRDVSSAGDLDDDGLTNAQETAAGTDPNNPDTDGDGLKDGAEVNTYTTSPVDNDTDNDGFPDGAEVAQGTDPKSAAGHLSNLARAGTAIIGTSEAVDGTGAGTAHVNAGTASDVNDGNLATRVDTYNRTDPASFAGILWGAPLADPVIRLELTFATFTNGGWFGPNAADPGPGGTLTAPEFLTEPLLQVTTNGGENWAPVAHTSDYLTALAGHVIGADGGPNPTSRTAVFTLTTPQTGINGIRIIGSEGGTASGGFLGVFELAIPIVSAADTDGDGLSNAQETTAGTNPNNPDTDGDGLTDGAEVNTHQTNPLNRDTDGDLFSDGQEITLGTDPKSAASQPANLALAGQAIMGVNDAVDGDAGTAYAQQGAPGILYINDGSLTTRVDTFNADTVAPVSFAGIVWSAPLAVPVTQAALTLATFGDGGWFGPNNAGPGGGGALTAPAYLTEPVVQVTTDGGLNWTPAPSTSDYLTVFAGHLIGGGAVPSPSSKTATFTLTSPQTGINGIRIIGSEGGTASGGFLGVLELSVSAGAATPDTDGDGQTDAEEAIAGTNPNSSTDYLRIVLAEPAAVPGQYILTWTSVTGKIYSVQSSGSLGTWTTVMPSVPAAGGPAGVTQATITIPAGPPVRLFYRVMVNP